ncbi:MAG TPA: DUF4271 domain-containing protein [Parafilimonas sp.]
MILIGCGLKTVAQDSSLFNSSWADSLKSAIQDSIRKNKNVAIKKNTAPVISHDSISVSKKPDSLVRNNFNDSINRVATIDSINHSVISDSIKNDSILATATLIRNDSIAKASQKIKKQAAVQKGMPGVIRNSVNTDLVFYVLIFIIFFLALVKSSFPKYFNSIFSLSFQATFRQTQTREQMSQNFFPAFMLNVLFILSVGLFITLFAQFYKWANIPFWQLFIYSTTILGVVYMIKYFVIFFTGWVFNAPDAAAEYRFIVFLINKLIGVLFIPILFVIAYSNDDVKKIAITIALCIAGLLIALRYLVSLARIRKNLNLAAFHFFIYLCAVEIMPLLVIYKILFLKTAIHN